MTINQDLTNPFIRNAIGRVTGSANAVRFPTGTCAIVRFKAEPANIGTFYIGQQNTVFFPLDAGDDTGWISIPRMQDFWYSNPSGTVDTLNYWYQV